MINTPHVIRCKRWVGFVLSLTLHGVLLGGLFFHRPAQPRFDEGVEAVMVTLFPSEPAPDARPPEPPVEDSPPTEQAVERPGAEWYPLIEPFEIVMPAPEPETEPVMEPAEDAHEPSKEELETATNPAPERDAGLREKGVETAARAERDIRPVYPLISRRGGEEGSVTVEVEVLTEGQPGAIRVLSSSGHERLDAAAVQAVRKTDFIPATRWGNAVRSVNRWTFTFRLEDAR